MEIALANHSDLLQDADRSEVLRTARGLDPVQTERAETESQNRSSGLGGEPMPPLFASDHVAHVGMVGTMRLQTD